MINRTPPCRSRAGGNPSARQVRGWIPVSTGMTLECPNLCGNGYKSAKPLEGLTKLDDLLKRYRKQFTEMVY